MENDLINVAIVNVDSEVKLMAPSLSESLMQDDGKIVREALKKYMSKRCIWCSNVFSRDKKINDENWKKKIFDTKYCIKRYNYVRDLYIKRKINKFFYRDYEKTGWAKRCWICGEKNKSYASDKFYRSIKRKFCSAICLRKFHYMRNVLNESRSSRYFNRLFNLEEEK